MDHEAINKARIIYYGMFASLFAFNFDKKNYATVVESVDILSAQPMDDESGEALECMKEILHSRSYQEVKDESDLVFFSPTTSLIPTTSSFYDEQRDDGRKRVDMMNYVLASKFRKNSETFKENEDHIEFISVFMQKLIEEQLQGNDGSGNVAKNVFENILNHMLDPLSKKLYEHENGDLYRYAAVVLDSFTQLERLYLGVAQPDEKMVRSTVKPQIKPRKIKKAPKELVTRNMDEFVSV
ncbi:TorD/DmsD family molecular chaperone [Desulforhopalus sp. 52FAK]